jgi:hypothetical protein
MTRDKERELFRNQVTERASDCIVGINLWLPHYEEMTEEMKVDFCIALRDLKETCEKAFEKFW